MVDKNIEGIVCGVHTLEGTVLYELRKSLKKDFGLRVQLMSKKAVPKSFVFFSNSLILSFDSTRNEAFSYTELKKLELFLSNFDIYYICFVNKGKFVGINYIYSFYKVLPLLQTNMFPAQMLINSSKKICLLPMRGISLILKTLIKN